MAVYQRTPIGEEPHRADMTEEASGVAVSRWRAFAWFKTQRITTQFLIAGGALMVVVTGLAGAVLSEIVQRDAIKSMAGSTALFIDAVAGNMVQELAGSRVLSDGARLRLDALLADPFFNDRFPYLDIWDPTGKIVYSNSDRLIGRTFPLSRSAQLAFEGQIASQLTDLSASEHLLRNLTTRYLEVYSPLRDTSTGRVIAVAEIHEVSTGLQDTLRQLQMQTWAIVLASGIAVMGGLYGIVLRGARQIDDQRRRLDTKVVELEEASALNRALRDRVQKAAAKVSEMNEQFLRKLGAELHDGPTQLLAFAILKVEHLRREGRRARRETLLAEQYDALTETAAEIRHIAKGLLLPNVMELDLGTLLKRVVSVHEARTGTEVAVNCAGLLPELPPASKICAYRFVQEGLRNAFRHAGGQGQQVDIEATESRLRICVLNDVGASGVTPRAEEERLGLIGMRERVESLGGTLEFDVALDGRTRLTMELDIGQEI